MFSFRFFFFLLFLIAPALAQPQAPITWEQPRPLFPDCPYPPDFIRGYGDTIIVVGIYYVQNTGQLFPNVTISPNNGITWSPWRVVGDTTVMSNNYDYKPVVTSQGIYIDALVRDVGMGLFRSTDLGFSWLPPLSINQEMSILDSYGDTILVRNSNRRVHWTNSGGLSYSPPVFAGGEGYQYRFVMGTSNHEWIHITQNFERDVVPINFHLITARKRYNDLAFGPYTPINPQIAFVQTDWLKFDEFGNGLIFSSVSNTLPATSYAMIRNTTHDNGETWSDYEHFTPFLTSEGHIFSLTRQDGFFTCSWADSIQFPPYHQPEHTTGVKVCVSANRLWSWYPQQQLIGVSGGVYTPCSVDISGNRIRVYCTAARINNVWGNYYLQISGTIHPDSLSPLLSQCAILPAVVNPIDSVMFSATASDNDSLWKIEAIVRRVGAPDSLRLPLIRSAGGHCSLRWLPPQEGVYQYYYYSEDMWLHKTRFPGGDPLVLQAGETAVREPSPLPEELTLSVYPNPGNHLTTITATLPLGASDAIITIHDILGREVYRSQPLRRDAGNNISLVWNTHTSNANGQSMIPLSSGIYFVQLRAGSYHIITKITLLQ